MVFDAARTAIEKILSFTDGVRFSIRKSLQRCCRDPGLRSGPVRLHAPPEISAELWNYLGASGILPTVIISWHPISGLVSLWDYPADSKRFGVAHE